MSAFQFEKYKDCGEKGKRYFKINFSKDKYIQKIEKIIDKVSD